ncbi:MAG: hypothetical protein IKK79_07830 [Spirochaetaceae bacterium]|nr:hypothetical protein [Spirochaetaceae bacterium]
MIKHPIRKFLGLTVLYSVIILGIFLLQFRSETALSQSFAGLRLQLVETQSDSQQRLLKNTFQATYKGLNIFADDQSPVTITKADDTVQPVSLYSWKEIDASNFTLYFDQAIALHFSIKTDDTGDFLSIEAELPEDTKNIAISYKPTSGYLVTEQNTRRLIISSKQQQYEVSAAEITSSHLVLSDMEQFATYNTFDPLYGFEFSMVNALPLSAETTFVETISKFKTDFIQLASQSLSEISTEQMVVAYVAAMAENRQYREAINKIPSSLKTGSRRTFLSAPYFNSLTAMNPSLQRHMENRRSMIDYAIQQKSLDIFTIQDLAQVLCTMEGNGLVEELLAMPASLADFNPSVAQAAGILDTYTQLVALNRNLSVGLQPILNNCLEIIAAACMLENNIIRLEENDAALPILDSISVGMSLISYGQLTGNIDYRATGNLIVNSYITPEVSSNLHIMTELYPIVVPNNPYYPHIQIIADASMSGNNTPVWAWTVARDTSYVRDSEGNATITLDFPSGETHHAIINGIRPFRRIDIYDISFRTDPKFESYNSSGYVFDAETQTLLLKSLHKVQREAIKFYYAASPTEPEAPESQAPATTTTTTQTSPPAAEVPTSTESS